LKFHPKKHLKAGLAQAAYSAGLLQRYVASRIAGRAAVLMYHRVLPPEAMASTCSADGIIVSTSTFRRQMETVRKYMHPMTVEAFAQALQENRLPERACLVTFDDGWFDNAVHALPILRELGVPAVVFIATDYIGTPDCFWQERLGHLLGIALQRQGPALQAMAGLLEFDPVALTAAADRRAALRRVIDVVKALPAERIGSMLREAEAIRRLDGADDAVNPIDRFMSWEDVAELHRDGTFTIGSHCCSHTPLTKLPPGEARSELARSRERIAAALGHAPLAMAYPNGDHSDAISGSAREAGYALAFTTRRGYASPAADAQQLPRINIHEHSTATPGMFLARVALLH
jgi:peptidoglycan/xylan/chitin deacetylase (PgdA/CDA1 family)